MSYDSQSHGTIPDNVDSFARVWGIEGDEKTKQIVGLLKEAGIFFQLVEVRAPLQERMGELPVAQVVSCHMISPEYSDLGEIETNVIMPLKTKNETVIQDFLAQLD